MVKPNIQKLADYINSQPDPERFMTVLLTFCKPGPDDLPDRDQEPKV